MSNLTTSLSNYTMQNDFGVSYYFYYVHPAITTFATFQSLLCTIVLASKELQKAGPFFQYSLLNSAGTAVAMFFLIFLFTSKCNSLCTISNQYFSQIYQIYVIGYFEFGLFIASALIQIAICLQLYLSIKRKFQKTISLYPFKVCATMIIASLVIALPNIFVNEIVSYTVYTVGPNGQLTWETIYSNRQSNSTKFLYYYSSALVIISNYVFLVILIGLNILIYIEFKKLIANKKKIVSKVHLLIRLDGASNNKSWNNSARLNSIVTNRLNSIQVDSTLAIAASLKREQEEKESLKKTLIVTLWVSVVFCFDRFVKALNRTVTLLYQFSVYNYYITAFSYFCDVFVCSSYIFIYLRTNKMFKKQFYKIFLRRTI